MFRWLARALPAPSFVPALFNDSYNFERAGGLQFLQVAHVDGLLAGHDGGLNPLLAIYLVKPVRDADFVGVVARLRGRCGRRHEDLGHHAGGLCRRLAGVHVYGVGPAMYGTFCNFSLTRASSRMHLSRYPNILLPLPFLRLAYDQTFRAIN